MSVRVIFGRKLYRELFAFKTFYEKGLVRFIFPLLDTDLLVPHKFTRSDTILSAYIEA